MAESPQTESLDVGIPGSGAPGFSVDASFDPIVSADQLQDVLEGVFRLREHWIERAPGFFRSRLSATRSGSSRPQDHSPGHAVRLGERWVAYW
jgi:hypothetical protein